jgi:hypothetical protein
MSQVIDVRPSGDAPDHPLQEVAEAVYVIHWPVGYAERLADYEDWAGFDDELGNHISLAYPEVEVEAF